MTIMAALASRPVWGAWIEMYRGGWCYLARGKSRPVWGAWIEIQTRKRQSVQKWSRAPYGARGLKSLLPKQLTLQTVVAPRMGRVD